LQVRLLADVGVVTVAPGSAWKVRVVVLRLRIGWSRLMSTGSASVLAARVTDTVTETAG
jgi:hypothetical protein